MKYEDFENFVRTHCHYETMYYDSGGRLMLIITMLEAYGMLNKAPIPTKLMGPNLEGVLNAAGFHKQREWQGLTDEEKLTIVHETDNPVDALAATEAKLKEKNT